MKTNKELKLFKLYLKISELSEEDIDYLMQIHTSRNRRFSINVDELVQFRNVIENFEANLKAIS